ncbi:MAG: hypothetical protein ACI9T8_000279 [Candidatus Saccharimonadales bacterium]|jgi:hypothetical protein
MDFANRGNRPTQAPQQSTNSNNDQENKPAKSGYLDGLDFNKFTSLAMLFAGTLLILAIVLALVFGGDNKPNSESDLILDNRYQAVFIDSQDGQVYFGKLGVYNETLYSLTDIFYVRVQNPIQPEGADQVAQPNISLAKLGSELHGPEDVMFISRDRVLYWENLKDDGQVVTAITNYNKNGAAEDTSTPAAGATQPAGTPAEDDTSGAEPLTP